MMVHVQYRKRSRRYHHDYVDTLTLQRLIEEKEIRWFYRPSEERWVNIYRDPIRGLGGDYSELDRRQPNTTTGG
jgi:hypothetical protein